MIFYGFILVETAHFSGNESGSSVKCRWAVSS
jgi:hypothetical protein